jgi:hypothetical protein
MPLLPRIRAASPEEALDVLQRCLDGLTDIYPDPADGAGLVEEAYVHLASDLVTVEDMEEDY